MSSNTDEPQLTRRQMRERRGVDTQGVPIVGAATGSAGSGEASKAVPAAPATRSRRVSTSAAVAGGQIPDVQAAERAAADASTDAEKAEAARQTAPALSLEEIAELEKRAQAGIPLTRRQARDLEKAKTASVPIISAADAAAARAASAAVVAEPDATVAAESNANDSNANDSNANDSNANHGAVENNGSDAGTDSDSDSDSDSDTGAGEASDDAANGAVTHDGDGAAETAPAKSSKRSKRAEKKAAQEAKRAEEAALEATEAEAAASSNGVTAQPATPVAPIRPAFIGKPAASAAPLIERLDSGSVDGEEASGRPGPRRSSYTPLGAGDTTVEQSTPQDDADAQTKDAGGADRDEATEAHSDTDAASTSRGSDPVKPRETIVVPEVVEDSRDTDSSAARNDADATGDEAADEADADAPKLAEGFGEQVLDAGTASSTAVPHEQPFDRIIARGVEAAEAQAASNALILPTMPTNDSLTGPISSNGNVIVTGSIDLPASLSSTGQHPNYFDKAELDTMFEADEEAAPATAGTPVSAARAVSTHTQTGDVINPPAPSRDHRLLIILAITAGALLTAVLAVVIVGFVVGAF